MAAAAATAAAAVHDSSITRTHVASAPAWHVAAPACAPTAARTCAKRDAALRQQLAQACCIPAKRSSRSSGQPSAQPWPHMQTRTPAAGSPAGQQLEPGREVLCARRLLRQRRVQHMAARGRRRPAAAAALLLLLLMRGGGGGAAASAALAASVTARLRLQRRLHCNGLEASGLWPCHEIERGTKEAAERMAEVAPHARQAVRRQRRRKPGAQLLQASGGHSGGAMAGDAGCGAGAGGACGTNG